MPLISSVDGANRRIYLDVSTINTSIHPIDIYKEMRTIRRNDETLRVFDLFMRADGNVSKGGGKFTERYVTLLLGTRIVPFDTSHELTIIGTVITDDGQEGISAFDRSSLTSTTVVDINYVPPQVEVITVNTGSGLTTAQDAKLTAIPDNPLLTDDPRITELITDVSFIRSIEGGRWEIVNNQMIFYKDDNTTEVARFDLKDSLGNATQSNPLERVRV